MNTYMDALKPEAEKKIAPLAATVRTLVRQLEHLHRRATTERGNVQGLEERLAALKGLAGERLTGGSNDFAKFTVTLKRVTVGLAAAKESVALFEVELIPTAERALAEAKARVQSALIAFVTANLPTCETKMAELLGQVLAERDSFMAAADVLFETYGGDFTGARRVYPDGVHLRPDPYRPDVMIGTSLEEAVADPATVQRRRGAYLSPPPSPSEAPPDAQDGAGATISDALDAPDGQDGPATFISGAVERTLGADLDTISAEVDLGVKGDGVCGGAGDSSCAPSSGADALPPDADAPDLDGQERADVDTDLGAKINADFDAEADAPTVPTPSETLQAADPPGA